MEKSKKTSIEALQYTSQQLADAKLAGFKTPKPEWKGKKDPTVAQKRALIKSKNTWVTKLLKAADKGASQRAEVKRVNAAFQKAGKVKTKKKD